MRAITLEEHFASPAFMAGPGAKLKKRAEQAGPAFARVLERLVDVGDARIAEMKEAGIDMQVVSLTSPGTEQLEAGTLWRSRGSRMISSPKPLQNIPIGWPPSPPCRRQRRTRRRRNCSAWWGGASRAR